MTPDERDLLSRFLDDLSHARPGPKDAEAATRIAEALRPPEAGYVLVQHAILADAALQDAQAHIAELERRLEEAGGGASAGRGDGGGFLGSLFGRARPNGDAGSAGAYPLGRPAPAVPTTAPGFGYDPGRGGASYPAAGGAFGGGGGLGSFLRGAGQTAAGVAGGAFLFEGLQGLFGGGRHESYGGFEGGERGFADPGGAGDPGQIDVGGDRFAGDGDAGVDYGAMDGDPGSDDYS